MKSQIDGVEIHGDYAAFWGSVFSNFYSCQFELEGKTWNCSEQYYMYHKALTFGDQETADKILETTEASEAKKLGRQVKDFDDKVWDQWKYHYMYKCVYAKFSQNEDLQDAMSMMHDKHFVEGSPVDGVWGVRLDWRDPRIHDPREWNGQNLLGRVLDEVRDDLGL